MNQEILIEYEKETKNNGRENSPNQLKGAPKRFSQISTAIHAYLYIAVMSLLVLIWTLTVLRRGLIFFWPIYPMFGWGFAIGYHIILYLSYNDKVYFLSRLRKKPYFGLAFITHAWFYISINTFLVVLNILFNPFPWSLFVIFGWGIGFGIHTIVASLSGSQSKKPIPSIEIKKTNYCYACGAKLGDRFGANFCAFCGNDLED